MRVSRWLIAFLVVNWAFLALYPDPRVLWQSVDNLRHPNVDPAAVSAVAARLPNDPNAIRDAVLTRIVPYAYDWQVDGVPWYFPTTAQALRAGRGDCESQAVVLASILKAKGIPYQLRMSFDHIWVQYAGQDGPTPSRTPASPSPCRSTAASCSTGRRTSTSGRRRAPRCRSTGRPMPLGRKLVFFGGIIALLFLNALIARARRGAGGASAARRRRRRRRAARVRARRCCPPLRARAGARRAGGPFSFREEGSRPARSRARREGVGERCRRPRLPW